MAEKTSTPFDRSYWVVPGQFLAGYYPGDRHRDLMEQKVQGLCDIMSMDEYLIIVSTDW